MSERIGDDEERSMSVRGREIKLARGSSIYVGFADNGDALLKFTSDGGTETKFGLSREAVDALRSLLDTTRVTDRAVCYGTIITPDRKDTRDEAREKVIAVVRAEVGPRGIRSGSLDRIRDALAALDNATPESEGKG